ncbi:hypothetical protein GCM10007978_29900 [Shewanella hanedai]|uniref:Uncharacterized protein n=1 Tax=Shewanella hanedai TaxID=25 RepID=A0A553JR48_SHEHA|nr:hypothetical protein [Shewanella hanedai]TRY14851.1 hypothetical protein FN961_07615 [Shewanella hanedai]GGI90312.1 hypothetical protein GCM10007978_29900 [Shewanella hanedai]
MLLIKLNDKINKDAWLLDDKQWVAERKKRWRRLSAFLRKGVIRPKDVKYYQTFFLTGLLHKPDDEFEYPHELCALILMILHPDQSEENLRGIYKYNVTLFNKGECDDDSVDFFYRSIFGSARDLTNLEGGYRDIFHGQEELYVKILYGDNEDEYKLRRKSRGDQNFSSLCSSMMEFILEESAYENEFRQYLIDFSFLAVEKTDFKERGRMQDDMPRFLQTIAHYELLDPFKNVNELRYDRAWKVVNHLRDRFNEPNLYPPLKELWEFAKTKEGRLTEYKFSHEYPILEKLHEGMEKLSPVKKRRKLPSK